MTDSLSFIHYGTIAAITAITSIGVGIGQGLTSKAALVSHNRQPFIGGDLGRSNLLGLALIETAAILALIFALLLFFNMPTNFYGALGEIGIAFALALPGFIIGIAASMPAQEALLSIARQPFSSKKITNIMLLTQSLLQTPLIFGFIIALIISNQASSITTLQDSLRLIASGLCIAIATIGPAIGGGVFTGSACRGVGVNQSAYSKIFSFTILSQAIIETPVIFAAIISFWLAFGITTTSSSLFHGLIYLAIAGVMGIGTIGAGISSGRTAAAACYQIALAPEHSTAVSRTSLIAQGLIDTSAIYAFIIALFLLLARF